MSTSMPPPFDPLLQYSEPPARDRPTSVTVLAVIGIILAALSVFCVGFALVSSLLNLSAGKNVFSTPAAPQPYSPALATWGAISSGIGMVMTVVLLVGCIGALYLRAWAWRAVMIWSILSIVIALIQSTVQLVWANPLTLQLMKEQQPNNPALARGAAFMEGFMIGGTAFGLVLACALPICFLIFWRRDIVRDAFAPSSGDAFLQT